MDGENQQNVEQTAEETGGRRSVTTPVPRQLTSAKFRRTPSRMDDKDGPTEGSKVLITQMSDDEDDVLGSQSSDEDAEVFFKHKYPDTEVDDGGYDTDLEIDDNAYLRGDNEFDPSGAKDYIKECNRVGAIPVSYFIRHIQNRKFLMKNHGLGPLGAKAIAKPLEINTTIEVLDLEGNHIEKDGAKYIARVLKDNLYISEMSLAENGIGGRGAKAICDALMENTLIRVVNLSGNNLKDKHGQMFFHVMEKNNTLKELYLSNNHFEIKAAHWFKEGLSTNESLRVIDLSWNHFRLKGAIDIADGLKENYGLKHCSLAFNGFGFEGAKAIGTALKMNQSLEDLDLTCNRIPSEGGVEIAKGLKANENLRLLKLGQNPIYMNGSTPLIMAIQRNETSAMQFLSLEGMMVNEEFDNLHRKVNEMENRYVTVVHAGILTAKEIKLPPPVKVDPDSLFWSDPMTKLKKYAEKMKLRLVDLFKQFDKDNSWSVDRDEFIQGVKSAAIPLTDEEIDILVNRLDKDGDGEIDYKELADGDNDNRVLKRQALEYKDGTPAEDPQAEEEKDPLASDDEN